MIKNYLKIALRNLNRFKAYSFITVFGLAIGLACFVLIFLFVQDELSYDRYHSKVERIYRVVEVIGDTEESSSQPFSVAPALLNDYPDLIEHAVRFFNFQAPSLALESSPERRFNETRLFFADSTVFRAFDFPFIKGGPERALERPNTVVLTQEMAQKYFGSEDPMNKHLRFEGKHDLTVTGILEKVPSNSHFKFDFLVSFSTLDNIFGWGRPRGWYWNPCWTYLTLKEGVSPQMLEAQFPFFVEKYFPETSKSLVSLYLQPLKNIHLRSNLDFEIEANSSIVYVYIFSASALFILLIACINFVNLSTARSSKRAREIGVRKVLGAIRGQLVKQFLGESFILTCLAVMVAIPLVKISLPLLNAFLGKELSLNPLENGIVFLALLAVIFVVSLFAGIYPALLLSSFKPVQVLKGRINLDNRNWSELLRKGLVVLQFAISAILIIGTFVAYIQLRHFQTARLGFEKEQIVMVPNLRTKLQPLQKYNEFKNQIADHRSILSVTATSEIIGKTINTFSYQPEGEPETRSYQFLSVRRGFINTFGIQLLAGRDFSEDFVTDDSMAVLINEAMVQHLNWGSPQQAVGREFKVRSRHGKQYVIGVVKDFHHLPLRNSISPLVIDIPHRDDFISYIAIRVSSAEISETLAFIEEKWNQFSPNRALEYFFLDQDLQKIYSAEEKLGSVAGVFAIFAIFVACLGLFGLASFTAEQRTKEIGVRKVLGATVTDIFLKLSSDFLKLVTFSFLLSWPVSYFLLNSWLEDFAYRVDIGITPFILAGTVCLLIAWTTVSFQAIKAALSNPVVALKYE